MGSWKIEGDYQRDGATCVRGAVGRALIDAIAAAIDDVVADPSPSQIRASEPSDGRFVEDFCNWRRLRALEVIVEEPHWGELAAELTGSDEIRFYHDHVLAREPGTAQRTPWHQDQPYYNVDGSTGISFWIPVQQVPLGESLQLAAGTHRGPWFVPRTFRDRQAKWFPAGALAEAPDFSDGTHRILQWALEPGDLIAFDMATAHAAPGTGPDRGRRVLSLRYLGHDMRYAPRPWTTSPPFPGLDDELDAGAPLDHPLFPVVWPPLAHPTPRSIDSRR